MADAYDYEEEYPFATAVFYFLLLFGGAIAFALHAA